MNKQLTLNKVDLVTKEVLPEDEEDRFLAAADLQLYLNYSITKLGLERTGKSLGDDTWCIRTEDGYPLVEMSLWLNEEQEDFPIWLTIMYDETVLIHHNVAQQSVEETMSIIQNVLTACEHLKAAHDITGNHEMGRD